MRWLHTIIIQEDLLKKLFWVDIMKIAKGNGLGNDFFIVEYGELPNEYEKIAKEWCDRKNGLYCGKKRGADGILFMLPAENADYHMRIVNSDGSKAETCFNGLRVASLWVYKTKKKRSVLLGTNTSIDEKYRDIVRAEIVSENNVEVEIPIKPKFKFDHEIKMDDFLFHCDDVDVGNPHNIVYWEDLDKYLNYEFINLLSVPDEVIEKIGHRMEYHNEYKPNRTNTHFIYITDSNYVIIRTHERGACLTSACGSGSYAVASCLVEKGLFKSNKWIRVGQPGGDLFVRIADKNKIRGHAEIEGEVEVSEWR